MLQYKDLRKVPPSQVKPNPENPRLVFRAEEIQELTDSIEINGVLVPLFVYADESDRKIPYVLVDGERRWRCSVDLGLAEIPVIVGPKPSDTDNLLSMFHIHLVREAWEDMPTVWALKKVSERTGITDPKQLAEKTGLKQEQVVRYQYAVSLPQEYQEMIMKGIVPLNFFFELKRNIIDVLRRRRPKIFAEIGEDAIIAAFVKKRLSGVTTDTVDLRDVSPIIRVAEREAGGSENAGPLDDAIRELINNEARTIKETYEDTVELTIEASKFERQCEFIIKRYEWLISKAEDEEDRSIIKNAARSLAQSLLTRVD
ncbi:MAG TPA: ParB/RepB/Spo0J family partition protein [Chthonomonadaceae bacterium]|nr:ParB/RepB/Spo0J family partition protein [Chthonomonadaceae bacterium]